MHSRCPPWPRAPALAHITFAPGFAPKPQRSPLVAAEKRHAGLIGPKIEGAVLPAGAQKFDKLWDRQHSRCTRRLAAGLKKVRPRIHSAAGTATPAFACTPVQRWHRRNSGERAQAPCRRVHAPACDAHRAGGRIPYTICQNRRQGRRIAVCTARRAQLGRGAGRAAQEYLLPSATADRRRGRLAGRYQPRKSRFISWAAARQRRFYFF